MLVLQICFVLVLLPYGHCQGTERKPLDDYVARPDVNYKFEIIGNTSATNVFIHNLNMTSQQWKTDALTNHPIWWHHLTIVIPDTIKYDTSCMLFIGAGSINDAEPPSPETDPILSYLVEASASLGVVAAYLNQIPNQPVIFKDDPLQESRSEDDIIGYTWKKFLIDSNATDPDVLLLFPMVKASVRAMDTIQTVVKQKANKDIKDFYLMGASKRGWTTFLTAAVDSRVKGIVPTVFSILNTMTNLHQHFRALGGWTWAFRPYWRNNITQFLDTPQGDKLAYHMDPYRYRGRLTMPKLLIVVAGDEFFLNQDSHVWWQNFTEPKYFWMLDTTGHDLAPYYEEIYQTVKGFFLTVVNNATFPQVSWQRSQTSAGGKIRFTTDKTPLQIRSWSAVTSDNIRRDWRTLRIGTNGTVDNNDIDWNQGTVNDLGNGVYEAEYPKPASGWISFYIETQYQAPNNETIWISSEVNISPDTFPFADCTGYACHGKLV